MPDDTRYYYWNEGSEVQGPHSMEELRQLHGEGVIGTQTQLCPEGGTMWQPFDLGLVLPPVRTIPPPPPPKPERWTGTNWWNRDTTGSHIGRKIFTGVAWLILILCSAFYMRFDPYDGAYHAPSASHPAAAIIAMLFLLWMIPFLLTILLPRWLRFWMRSSLVILFSLGLLFVTVFSIGFHFTAMKAIVDLNERGRNLILASNEINRRVPSLDPTDLKTMDDLTQDETAVLKLRSSYADVLDFFTHYDEKAREALTAVHMDSVKLTFELAAAHKTANIDGLAELWRLKVQLCDDQLARLSFLEKNWGHWNVRDSKVMFEDQATADSYNLLVEALQKDIADLAETKKKNDAKVYAQEQEKAKA
jgi:hypothetical protein